MRKLVVFFCCLVLTLRICYSEIEVPLEVDDLFPDVSLNQQELSRAPAIDEKKLFRKEEVSSGGKQWGLEFEQNFKIPGKVLTNTHDLGTEYLSKYRFKFRLDQGNYLYLGLAKDQGTSLWIDRGQFALVLTPLPKLLTLTLGNSSTVLGHGLLIGENGYYFKTWDLDGLPEGRVSPRLGNSLDPNITLTAQLNSKPISLLLGVGIQSYFSTFSGLTYGVNQFQLRDFDSSYFSNISTPFDIMGLTQLEQKRAFFQATAELHQNDLSLKYGVSALVAEWNHPLSENLSTRKANTLEGHAFITILNTFDLNFKDWSWQNEIGFIKKSPTYLLRELRLTTLNEVPPLSFQSQLLKKGKIFSTLVQIYYLHSFYFDDSGLDTLLSTSELWGGKALLELKSPSWLNTKGGYQFEVNLNQRNSNEVVQKQVANLSLTLKPLTWFQVNTVCDISIEDTNSPATRYKAQLKFKGEFLSLGIGGTVNFTNPKIQEPAILLHQQLSLYPNEKLKWSLSTSALFLRQDKSSILFENLIRPYPYLAYLTSDSLLLTSLLTLSPTPWLDFSFGLLLNQPFNLTASQIQLYSSFQWYFTSKK